MVQGRDGVSLEWAGDGMGQGKGWYGTGMSWGRSSGSSAHPGMEDPVHDPSTCAERCCWPWGQHSVSPKEAGLRMESVPVPGSLGARARGHAPWLCGAGGCCLQAPPRLQCHKAGREPQILRLPPTKSRLSLPCWRTRSPACRRDGLGAGACGRPAPPPAPGRGGTIRAGGLRGCGAGVGVQLPRVLLAQPGPLPGAARCAGEGRAPLPAGAALCLCIPPGCSGLGGAHGAAARGLAGGGSAAPQRVQPTPPSPGVGVCLQAGCRPPSAPRQLSSRSPPLPWRWEDGSPRPPAMRGASVPPLGR